VTSVKVLAVVAEQAIGPVAGDEIAVAVAVVSPATQPMPYCLVGEPGRSRDILEAAAEIAAGRRVASCRQSIPGGPLWTKTSGARHRRGRTQTPDPSVSACTSGRWRVDDGTGPGLGHRRGTRRTPDRPPRVTPATPRQRATRQERAQR
jgi:hypothetical protein